MTTTSSYAHLTFAFGLLGNVVTFTLYLSPTWTFYEVYKKKSTEGFQSVPYVLGLFCNMFSVYYGLLQANAVLLLPINSIGCFMRAFFICFFLFYAQKKARMESLKLIGLMMVVGLGLILGTQLLANGGDRVKIVGWICILVYVSAYAAPFGIVKLVIKTRSVEYMPILLSVALTLSATTWVLYGSLLHDFYIALPHALGFIFGVIQIIIYFIYKYKKPVCNATEELSQKNDIVVDHMPNLNIEVVE